VTRVPQWTGFARKTLWDWLQLLIVPAILIGVTFAWSATQTRSDNKREDRRIAADRAAAEKARKDATLQAYLDQMSGLMLHEKLLISNEGDSVRAVARTVTLAALRRLDAERKTEVVRFLAEAKLLSGRAPQVLLVFADLSNTDLAAADLERADLSTTRLAGALLVAANLKHADLSYTDLSSARLQLAHLAGANLDSAHLTGADLRDADLTGADLEFAYLSNARLAGAHLAGADLEYAHLAGVDLAGVDLMHANLANADLKGANLAHTRLADANLVSASLEGANNLDLDGFITHLPPDRQKVFLDYQKAFLDSLSREQLSKFNLSPEKLARIRREASVG
jgi:uncharacterized protein YjbI with pentapeptide repeats